MSRRETESYNWLDDPFDEKKAAAEHERMNAKGAFPVAGCLIVGVVALILVVALFVMGALTLGTLASA